MIPLQRSIPFSNQAALRTTNAPKAPASFQSPAPRLRRKTNGKSSSNPNPAPSRATSRRQSSHSAFATIPHQRGTVSQFGIRRLRQSVSQPLPPKLPPIPTPPVSTISPGSEMLLPEPWLAEVVELASLSTASGLREGQFSVPEPIYSPLTRIFT